MDFLGIGSLELLTILLLMLIVLGPAEIADSARKVGRFIHKVRSSSTWRELIGTQTKLQHAAGTWLATGELSELRDQLAKNPLAPEHDEQLATRLLPGRESVPAQARSGPAEVPSGKRGGEDGQETAADKE